MTMSPGSVISPPSLYPQASPASLHPSLQSASLSPGTPLSLSQTLQVNTVLSLVNTLNTRLSLVRCLSMVLGLLVVSEQDYRVCKFLNSLLSLYSKLFRKYAIQRFSLQRILTILFFYPSGQGRPSVPPVARRGSNVAVSKRTRFALQVKLSISLSI